MGDFFLHSMTLKQRHVMSRLFIAIDFPPEFKHELGKLRIAIPGAKWVPEEQLHLTLAFLGDTDTAVIPCVTQSLATIHASSFTLRYAGTGCFPDRRRPRVLWVGLEPQPLLYDLVEEIHASVAACGIPWEPRPFSPHVTLARLKSAATQEFNAFLTQTHITSFFPVDVHEFILFESRLTSHGAFHTIVQAFKLTG